MGDQPRWPAGTPVAPGGRGPGGGRFRGEMRWRTFPSSLVPAWNPGDDPLDAVMQIRRSESEYNGLGRWWFGVGDGEHDTDEDAIVGAKHYAAPGSVLVGVRFPEGAQLREYRDSSGLVATEPTEVLVEQVHIMGEDGRWQPLEVPAGLTAWTRRPDDWADRVSDGLALRRAGGTDRPDLEVREYDGEEGNRDHITRVERGMVPIGWVRDMPGARGEHPGQHRNRQDQQWEEFKAALAAGGESGIHAPLFITVDYDRRPRLSEGNHRRDAYVELGATHVPVEIRYYGHAERQGTVEERAR